MQEARSSPSVVVAAPTPPAWSHNCRNQRRESAINSKLFVGNLSFDTTTDDLRALFAEAGEVVGVVMPTDRMSGRPRGFAFVEFASTEHAAAAMQKFDGFELAGRKLRVNEANSERSPRPSSGGFGGGFGQDRPGRRPPRPKGSRRNIRSRKRSIW